MLNGDGRYFGYQDTGLIRNAQTGVFLYKRHLAEWGSKGGMPCGTCGDNQRAAPLFAQEKAASRGIPLAAAFHN